MALRVTPLTAVSAFTANIYPPQANSTIASADVQSGEQALLNRTEWLNDSLIDDAIKQHTAAFSAAYPASISTVSSATATDTAVLVDVPNVKLGDRFDVHVNGVWILTGQTASTVIGKASFKITDDKDGGATNTFPNGYAAIVEQVVGANTVQSYSLHAQHEALAAGTSRFRLQLCYEDLAGGADTATVALLLVATIDVTRYRCS